MVADISERPYYYQGWSQREKPEGWPDVKLLLRQARSEGRPLRPGYERDFHIGDRIFTLSYSATGAYLREFFPARLVAL